MPDETIFVIGGLIDFKPSKEVLKIKVTKRRVFHLPSRPMINARSNFGATYY